MSWLSQVYYPQFFFFLLLFWKPTFEKHKRNSWALLDKLINVDSVCDMRGLFCVVNWIWDGLIQTEISDRHQRLFHRGCFMWCGMSKITFWCFFWSSVPTFLFIPWNREPWSIYLDLQIMVSCLELKSLVSLPYQKQKPGFSWIVMYSAKSFYLVELLLKMIIPSHYLLNLSRVEYHTQRNELLYESSAETYLRVVRHTF